MLVSLTIQKRCGPYFHRMLVEQEEERLEQNQVSYLRADIAFVDYDNQSNNENNLWTNIKNNKKTLNQKQLYPSEFYVYEVSHSILFLYQQIENIFDLIDCFSLFFDFFLNVIFVIIFDVG